MKAISFIPAIIWFVISFILLVLPGDNLPHTDLFNIPNFDKFVHLVMFFLLTFLFCYTTFGLYVTNSIISSWFKKITLSVILYGVVMEFVQKYCVFGRSFDVVDIIFDSAGSLIGFFTARQYYIKKIGPDGNQGRNQN